MLYSSLLLSHRISPYPKFSRQNLCLASICIWRNYISTILCFYNCLLGPYSMTSSGANTSTLGCSFLILKEGCCSLTTWRPWPWKALHVPDPFSPGQLLWPYTDIFTHKCQRLRFHLLGYSFDQITLLDLFLVIWLSDMWFANISFHSVGCLCAFLMLSFAQSFSFWWNPVFDFFFLLLLALLPYLRMVIFTYWLVTVIIVITSFASSHAWINMSSIWGCSDPLNHSFTFYHVIAVHALVKTPSFHHFRKLQGRFLNLLESEQMCWKCWIKSKTCSL